MKDKAKVIVKNGVMLLEYKGEIIPNQIDMELKDNCYKEVPVATLSLHVDIVESIPKKEINYERELQDYKEYADKLKAEIEYHKECYDRLEKRSILESRKTEMTKKQIFSIKKMLKYCFNG